jgi:hypothetical protein
MVTGTQQKIVKTVEAAVTGKRSVGVGETEVELLIAAFDSRHSIPVKLPKAAADALEVGYVYTIRLAQENLRKDKQGNPHAGTRPWHYWWGWAGLATKGTEDPQAPETPAAVVSEVQSPGRRDTTGRSIERQQALIQANIAYWKWVETTGDKATDYVEASGKILRIASLFAAYLATGNPAVEAEATEEGEQNA